MLIPRNLITFLFIAVFSIPSNSQGYDIKLQINGLADTSLILGHYLSKSMYPDDTVRLDNKGAGVLQGHKKLQGGIYIVLLPSSNYFEIIMGDDQNFNIEVDTANFLQTLNIKGSEENQIFL